MEVRTFPSAQKFMRNKVIYLHIGLDNNEIFYVGKGWKRRPYYPLRSEFWHRYVDKHGYRVEVIYENLTEDEATWIEISLIKYYGRRNINKGTLVNLTDGGEGSIGFKHSEETLLKLSDLKSGKNNPFYNKKHTEETKILISSVKKNTGLGKTNSQYGTCWIYQDQINKKIKKTDLNIYIQDGWIKGRKCKTKSLDVRADG